MTEEEKQLLFKDLVARLPYTPMVNLRGKAGYDRKLVSVHRYTTRNEFEIVVNSDDDEDYMPHNFEIDIVKPYLRPLSSMTEDERLELSRLTGDKFKFYLYTSKPEIICYEKYNYLEGLKVLDWLIAHHFDIYGLIEKGLALEAPEEMYKF